MIPIRLLALLTLALLAGACRPGASLPGSTPATESPAQWIPREALPPLRTIPLRVGSHPVQAEVAIEPREQATGLMFRERMEPEAGMLFVFPFARPVAFYMRNTRIPLTVAYIDGDGVIRELHDLDPFVERPVNSENPDIRFVLEMNRGWFATKGIAPGVRITAGTRSLAETFPATD